MVVFLGLPVTVAGNEPAPSTRGSYRAELAAGWRFLRGDAVLLAIVCMVAVTNLLDQAFASVLLVVWTENGGHDAALMGLLLATFSGASIAGAALATMIGERLPRLAVYTVAFLLIGLPRFLVFALDAPLPTIFVTLAIGGFCSGFLNPIISAVMFERVPGPLVGRVTALVGALTWALIPFGGLVGGLLIARFGLAVAFAACGVAYFLVTLSPLFHPAFRGFGDSRRQIVQGAPQRAGHGR